MTYKTRASRGSSRGFTLIELLVVVAIIAVLISILLPSLNLARKQAKQLLCVTHLRSQGQAAYYYAEQNKDWYVRHNADYANMHFAAAFLAGLKPDRRLEFWNGSVKDAYDFQRQRRLIDICEAIPQYQCPSHPVAEQKLDYVVNGFPWPYTTRIARRDRSGGGQKGEGPRGQSGGHWVNFFKLSGQSLDGNLDLKVPSQPFDLSRRIYITEGHLRLSTSHLRYHDLFYTSQLPLAAYPRVANDQRHPGGITSLFFDGHAQVMWLHSVDSGWPNTIGHRLRWFASVEKELY